MGMPRSPLSMQPTPLISVLLPAYNGMPYLPETMESVLAQTFRDFELIVLDDGSSDNTPQYLGTISDSRMRVVRLNRGGLAAALNHGLQVARAPIIARIDADDVALPDRFRLQYDYLETHPACLAVGTQSQQVNERGEAVGEGRYPTTTLAIRWQALFRSPVLHPSSMYRLEPVRAVGGYRQEFDVAEDYDLWTRLLARGELGNLPGRLLRYRVHSRSVCALHKDKQIGQGSRVAGAYAVGLGAGVEATPVEALYLFLATGAPPQKCSMGEIIRAFHTLRRFFLQQARDSDMELNLGMDAQQDALRWRCTALAEANWRRPWRALAWLRHAGQVDPEKAGFLGRVRRRLSKFLGRVLIAGSPVHAD
jgi:Glycosyl transferase family 2